MGGYAHLLDEQVPRLDPVGLFDLVTDMKGYQTLRVHVPKHYIRWPQCTYMGTSLRPTYRLYEYMDP